MLSQRLIRDVLYPLNCWRSGELRRLEFLREFERSQYVTPYELRKVANQRLIQLVTHAYEQCPFYTALYREAGITAEDIKTVDCFESLPVVEKRHIQEQREAMVAQDWPKDDLIENKTGGSTGTPISFFLCRERIESRAAATWRHNRWAGYDIGTKVATLWGAARDIPSPTLKQRARNRWLDRTITLNTAAITEAELQLFHERLLRFKPQVIVAYANAVALFARFLKARGAASIRVNSVITTAEVLEDADRLLIEDVFGCRVFNRYGCREVSVIASECEQHDGLHIMAEGLLVEVLRGNQPCPPGVVGEVVITDLLNFAMPLIRYRIGDMAVYDPAPCACGRGLPRLRNVAGRVTDFLVGTDGRLVSGAALTVTVVAARPSLGQVQIRQEAPGEILFRIAPPPGRTPAKADLDFLVNEARAYLGCSLKVAFEVVDRIAPEASGKFIFSYSRVARDLIERGHIFDSNST